MGPKTETVSTRPKPCGKAEFTCSNRKCIPAQLQCDLFDDCGDGGSDEQDCKACMCLPNLSDTSVGKQAILSDLRQSWWITWTHAVHLELSFKNHSGLSSRWVFYFFFLIHILFVANDQASKHKKKSHHALGQWGASIKYVTSKLSLIPASNGDICGKRMNPCGEDAVCNHTNTNAICHCKPGFQRNLRSRKCEGTVRLSSLILLAFRKMIHCFIWGGMWI